MAKCRRHPLHDDSRCPECHSDTRVYFTRSGHAYHVSKDCPSLNSKRIHPIDFAKAIDARGRSKSGCHQCVNGWCVKCEKGKHDKCDPESNGLEFCVCSFRGHRDG